MQTSKAPRLIGRRLPEPIATGVPFYSSGDTSNLRADFSISDTQALDAPYSIASGGLTTMTWTTDDGLEFGVVMGSVSRAGAWR